MGNLGLNARMHWLSDTDGRKCFSCKNGVEDAGHFVFDCMSFRENFTILWSNLKATLFNASSCKSCKSPLLYYIILYYIILYYIILYYILYYIALHYITVVKDVMCNNKL